MGQGLHRPLASLSIPLGRETPDWEEQSCAEERRGPHGSPSCTGACLCTSPPPPEHPLAQVPLQSLHLAVLMGTVCFCRDQQPPSTMGAPPEAPQAQMFNLPMLQHELRPESLQPLLAPIW